jgi:hypothetical protein
MSTVYTFIPTKLTVYSETDGKQDVVFNIDYRFSATDGRYGYLTTGSCTTGYVAGQPFTPYSDLTEEQVVEWIKASLGRAVLAQMQDQADAAIAAQYKPAVVTPPLPWEYANGEQVVF